MRQEPGARSQGEVIDQQKNLIAMYRRKRTGKSKKHPNKEWISYIYLDKTGKPIPLGTDLNLARLK